MIAAIWKISPAALQVVDNAPPVLRFPFGGARRELATFVKDRAAVAGWPRDDTSLSALSPEKEFMPPTYRTLGFFLLGPEHVTAAAAESAAAEMAAIELLENQTRKIEQLLQQGRERGSYDKGRRGIWR